MVVVAVVVLVVVEYSELTVKSNAVEKHRLCGVKKTSESKRSTDSTFHYIILGIYYLISRMCDIMLKIYYIKNKESIILYSESIISY